MESEIGTDNFQSQEVAGKSMVVVEVLNTQFIKTSH
jgi:hypothetical protein